MKKEGRYMKVCPRCGAVAFDDAKVCYGCLYDFSTARRRVDDTCQHANISNGNSFKHIPLYSDHVSEDQDPPEFCIRFTPRRNACGGWKWDCSVQVKEKIQHEAVGHHAV